MIFLDVQMLRYMLPIMTEKADMLIFFGVEYVIMLANMLTNTLKYGVHYYDNVNGGDWEDKGLIMFYIEVISGKFIGFEIYHDTYTVFRFVKIGSIPLFLLYHSLSLWSTSILAAGHLPPGGFSIPTHSRCHQLSSRSTHYFPHCNTS